MLIPIRKKRRHQSIFALLSAIAISNTAAQAAPSVLNPQVGQEITVSQADSLSGYLTFPNADYSDEYFIGIGIFGDIDVANGESGILLDESQTIIANNMAANSGAIGLAIAGATVGGIKGTITSSAVSAAHGLRITGSDYFGNNSGRADVSYVSGSISATTTAGSAIGIDLANGHIGTIENTSITIDATLPSTREVPQDNEGILLADQSSIGLIKNTTITATLNANNNSASLLGISIEDNSSIGQIENLTIVATNNSTSASVVGINHNSTGSVGLSNGINTHMTINAVDGLASFITTRDPSLLGTISGYYEMNALNTKMGISQDTYSVGYLLGDTVRMTYSSLGFSAANETGYANSAGINVNWNDTTMVINRNYGYSTGVVIMGHQNGLEKTVLGAGSKISTTVKEGLAIAAWICGMDLSEGALLGDLSATAETGLAFGLAGTATDLVDNMIVNQNYGNTSFGHISGNISATVENETDGTKSVGVQLGNVFIQDGKLHTIDTEMTGFFTGNISAKLNNSINADGSLQSSTTGNVVAGIIDMGNQTLKFDGTTQGTNNAYGTKVSAEIYHNKELRAYGDAVLTLTGGIKLSSEGKTTATAASFVGNFTAGMGASGSGTESLQFEKGNFQVTSESWNAQKGIIVGSSLSSSVGALYQTASVTLHDIASTVGDTTTFNSSSLSFYANSMTDSSLIKVMNGVSLDLEGLTTVNIYLAGDDSMYGPLFFLDATLADSFDADNSGITYKLYFDGIEYTQSNTLKIVHDSNGIYLSTGAPIPEPSTASLSLVALAGLLSRRRRKK